MVYFWYRVGEQQFAVPTLLGESSAISRLSAERSGMDLRLDGQGRLVRFVVIPTHGEFDEGKSAPTDWAVPFSLANLTLADFHPVRPLEPPIYANEVVAWEGVCTDHPEMPVRINGAALNGRVVYFEVSPILQEDKNVAGVILTADDRPSRMPWRTPIVRLTLNLIAIIGGGILAWRNVRLGRGDYRGARRLVAFILLLGLLDWLLGERHVAVLSEEIASFYVLTARATLTAAIAWVLLLCRRAVCASLLAANHDHLEPHAPRDVPRPRWLVATFWLAAHAGFSLLW